MSGTVIAGTSTDLRIGTDNTDAQDDAVRQAFAVPGKNFILNPSGEINQAGLASTADGAYDFDQWVVMTQTAAVTPSQVTAAEDGTPFMMRLTQAQASAQRMGRVEWIEGKFCKELRGQAVTLSARVRMSATTTLRYAIMSWTGTEDTITLDQVNDWTSGTYTAGNFFKNTTITIEATGSIALTADTLTDITALTDTAISSSMNNLAVIFWTDSAQAQNVTLDIAKVKLERGQKATQFFHPDWGKELCRCQRYLYALGGNQDGVSNSTNTTYGGLVVKFSVPMRAIPTLLSGSFTVDSGNAGTAGLTTSSVNQTGHYNTANNWTTNTGVHLVTPIYSARL